MIYNPSCRHYGLYDGFLYDFFHLKNKKIKTWDPVKVLFQLNNFKIFVMKKIRIIEFKGTAKAYTDSMRQG